MSKRPLFLVVKEQVKIESVVDVEGKSHLYTNLNHIRNHNKKAMVSKAIEKASKQVKLSPGVYSVFARTSLLNRNGVHYSVVSKDD